MFQAFPAFARMRGFLYGHNFPPTICTLIIQIR
nr:MAG TPA: hypothetical protein [Caudoviricetes sp.]